MRPARAPIHPITGFQIGDTVRTPSGRIARVEDRRADGLLDLRYFRDDGRLDMTRAGEVCVRSLLLKFGLPPKAR